MARPLRVQYPDAWYHVMNRGRRGENIFTDDLDYKSFIALLQETCSMWKIRIAAYCLMSNHYHVLIQTPEGNLDRCMRHINGIYTQRYNRRHHHDGQVFRGRYKSLLVDADNYLLELVRYIHRNPVRAGIVTRLKDYPWSSHKGYMSGKEPWVCSDFVLSVLEQNKSVQLKSYINFVNKEDSKEIKNLFSRKNLPSVFGDESFVERIRERFFRLKPHAEIPETKLLTCRIDEIKDAVSKFYNVSQEVLVISRRGVGNEPRNVALYLARHYTGKKLVEIGRTFNINNYSTVSTAICKIDKEIKTNNILQKRIDKIRKNINKGQQQT